MIIQKVNRPIKYMVIHCAATKVSMNISASDINRWHKAKGWSGIGYNHYIKLDGTIEEGRSLEVYGAHTLGRNHDSIGICLEGGMSEDGKAKDTLTVDQWQAVMKIFKAYKKTYPNLLLSGHNQWNVTSCPAFDVREYVDKHDLTEYCYQGALKVKLR